MSNRSISLTFATVICFILLSYATTISGSDPQPVPPKAPNAKTPLDKQATLKDISRIREQLGGGVLKGSILDDGVSDPFDFDAGLRSELGLPKKPAAKPNGQSKLNRSNAEIIKSLRKHCAKLDEIANHIETLREYEYADSMRESAVALRMIARQMDTRQARSPQTESR